MALHRKRHGSAGAALLTAALLAACPTPAAAQLPPPVGDVVDGVVDQLPPPVADPVRDIVEGLPQLPAPPVPSPVPVPTAAPTRAPTRPPASAATATPAAVAPAAATSAPRPPAPRRPARAVAPAAPEAPASRPVRREVAAVAPAPSSAPRRVAARDDDAAPADSPPRSQGPPSFSAGVSGAVADVIRAIPPAILWALAGISLIAIGLAVNAYWQSRRRTALEAQRAALLDDIGLLSRALLPAMPDGLDGDVAVSAAYRPADGPAAGGDFYDVFALGDDRVGVLLGDVSGHGRESVTQAALARYTLRTLLAAGDPPGEALARADVLLERDLRPNFVTVIAGVYDPRTGELTYAKAGHAPPIVLGTAHDPDAEEPAPPLGTGVWEHWPEYRLRLGAGVSICLFTDGLQDAQVGDARLGRDAVERLFAAQPVPDAARLLEDIEGAADRMCDDTAAVVLSRPVHKSVRARCCPRCVELHHDGWAIRSLPPGRRDLGEHELWERSLVRSRRRREYAALQRTPVYRKKRALVSAALLTATVLAPTHDAAKAQGTEVANAASGELLRIGSRGPAVAELQRMLGIPADGVFGRQTRGAVRSYQAAHGLEVDGIAGPITRGSLRGGSGGGGGVSQRLPAATTIAVQRALGIAADGVFGRQTRRAVRAFQASHGLEVDGVVGPQTLGALGISGATTPAGGGGGSAVAAARTKLGAPYALGGEGPTSWDCSGLTQWAFAQAGVTLPRTSFQQASVGAHVDRAAVQAGDLVFFDANGPGASHVGIATSNGTAISATSHGVREHALSGPYWGKHYYGARRVG